MSMSRSMSMSMSTPGPNKQQHGEGAFRLPPRRQKIKFALSRRTTQIIAMVVFATIWMSNYRQHQELSISTNAPDAPEPLLDAFIRNEHNKVDEQSLLPSNKPTAFLHVGPEKMATTFLQSTFSKLHNYEILIAHNFQYIGSSKQRSEAFLMHSYEDSSSFIQGGEGGRITTTSLAQAQAQSQPHSAQPVQMTPKFHALLDQAKQAQSNAIVVFEMMERWQDVHIQALADAITERDFHVHIIVGYRRFFEYAVSLYNQKIKPTRKLAKPTFKIWPDEHANGVAGEHIPPLRKEQVHELFLARTDNWTIHPSLQALRRYQRYFPTSTFDVLDIHRPVLSVFVCDILRSAELCQTLEDQWDVDTSAHRNPSYPVCYDRIAVDAYQQGMFTNPRKQTRSQIVERIATWHHRRRDVPALSFTICPSEAEKQWWLDVSLSMEREPLVEHPQPDKHREAFEQQFAKSFCLVNTTEVLQDEKWKLFFRRIR